MKTGITFSTFDLLHAGHIGMLREAKANCDYLIVGLQSDPTIDNTDTKNEPIQTGVERYAQLYALKFVDEIVPYQTEQDVIDILELFQLDVRFLGEEYREKEFTGRATCAARGIDIYFNKREHRFSSSDLRNRVCAKEHQKNANRD